MPQHGKPSWPGCASRRAANMPAMPHLLVIAHAPLASALRQVAEHTFPDCAPTLTVLDVQPGIGAQRLAGDQVQVLSGVSVPMLWRSLCYASRNSLTELARCAAQGAATGVVATPS